MYPRTGMRATPKPDISIVNVITCESYHNKYAVVNCSWVPERCSVGVATSLTGCWFPGVDGPHWDELQERHAAHAIREWRLFPVPVLRGLRGGGSGARRLCV